MYTFSYRPGTNAHRSTRAPWGSSVIRKRMTMAYRRRLVLPIITERFLVVKENLWLLLCKEWTSAPTNKIMRKHGSSLPTMAYNKTFVSTRVWALLVATAGTLTMYTVWLSGRVNFCDSVRKRVGNRGSHGYDEGRTHNSGCLEILRPFGNVVPVSHNIRSG